MEPGINCSLRVKPEEFVESSARARAINYERVMKFSRSAASDLSKGATLPHAELPVRTFVDVHFDTGVSGAVVRQDLWQQFDR